MKKFNEYAYKAAVVLLVIAIGYGLIALSLLAGLRI